MTPDKQVRLVRGDRDAFGLRGRSAEPRIALELLLDPEVGIVAVVEKRKGHPLFAHVTLTHSERSPIAASSPRGSRTSPASRAPQ